ncbi:hypothetical protein H1C71_018679 [Ictidomys tridecemlineatus]|nr:hypothetical protein H1C71_018679 [Ictidomys tridecemlineatus]
MASMRGTREPLWAGLALTPCRGRALVSSSSFQEALGGHGTGMQKPYLWPTPDSGSREAPECSQQTEAQTALSSHHCPAQHRGQYFFSTMGSIIQHILRVLGGLLVGNGVDEILSQIREVGEQAKAVLEAEPRAGTCFRRNVKGPHLHSLHLPATHIFSCLDHAVVRCRLPWLLSGNSEQPKHNYNRRW